MYDILTFLEQFKPKIEVSIYNGSPPIAYAISQKLDERGIYWSKDSSHGIRFEKNDLEINVYLPNMEVAEVKNEL